MDHAKRELRELKREIKRLGSKRRRRQLKHGLAQDPETAHEASFSFGRFESAGLNGIDQDSTRNRERPEVSGD